MAEGKDPSIGEGARRGEAAVETDWASSLLSIFVVKNKLIVALERTVEKSMQLQQLPPRRVVDGQLEGIRLQQAAF